MIWGQAVKNWGQLLGTTAKGGFGRTAAGALWGMGMGGLYGAMSDKTSILGGMGMGLGLGAGLARYGGAGAKGIMRAAQQASMTGAPRIPYSQMAQRGMNAMWGQMRGDFSRLRTNQIGSRIKGLWTR